MINYSRMVKGRIVPAKFLFHVATQTDNRSTLIEKSALLILFKNWHLLTPHSYIAISNI